MTLTLPRRKFLTLAAGLVAAPAIVRVGSIMPVKAAEPVLYGFDNVIDFGPPEFFRLTQEDAFQIGSQFFLSGMAQMMAIGDSHA